MDSRKSSMLTIGTLLISCVSCAVASRQQPAFILPHPSVACRQSIRHKCPMPIRMEADHTDDNIDDDEDEITFKRLHGSYQIYNDEHDNTYGDDDDEDELQSQLNKISWLPSLLSKRRSRSSFSRSRRDNVHGDAYDTMDGINPKDIEILPVLPLQMVKHHDIDLTYASGVWAEGFENDLFSTPAYLPHTGNHVLAVAEPRYKKLYDDLLQLGEYWGQKRKEALRDARRRGIDLMHEEDLPNPEEKRRFIGTVMHPNEEGVLAQYGVLFQLRDLDEVSAIASYDQFSVDDVHNLMDTDEVDLDDLLLDNHYEASHDIVGIVKIQSVLNPECWTDDPEEEEYLMAEATVVELTSRSKDRAKPRLVSTAEEQNEKKAKQADLSTVLSVAQQIEAQTKQQTASKLADAVSRIKDELRSAVDEAFQQSRQTSTATRLSTPNKPGAVNSQTSNHIPLVPKGILIEKRTDESLLKEEEALRHSFAKLVSLQQELKEKFRFTRDSVKSFGVGNVGLWLSTAAWSKFIDKRLEGVNAEIQSDLQAELMEYLSETRGEAQYDEDTGQETIDFDDLPPDLQDEYIESQGRAIEECGPAALQRAIQLQRIVQAENDAERLNVLKECIDEEKRRLLAKKMLKLATADLNGSIKSQLPKKLTPRKARAVFERLMKEDNRERGDQYPEDAFQ
ncbi:hypothetical protein ACHAXN_003188 [Cyclotella atomus]